MATLGQDLRSFIIGSTGVLHVLPTAAKAGVVELDRIPEQPPRPRVWMRCRRRYEELDLSGVGGTEETDWDLEIISTSNSSRDSIVSAIKERLHGHIGTMGTRKVQWIAVEDHDDDYMPRGLAGDEDFYYSALSLTIVSPTT